MFSLLRRNRDFFDDFFNDLPSRSANGNLMNTDIIEKEDKYLLTIEMPGFSKDDVKVTVEKGYLVIEAERQYDNEKQDENDKLIRRERFYGTVKRNYYIGNIELKDIKGSFKDGILSLEVPKESKEISTKEYLVLE